MRTIYQSINNLPLPVTILECNHYLAVQYYLSFLSKFVYVLYSPIFSRMRYLGFRWTSVAFEFGINRLQILLDSCRLFGCGPKNGFVVSRFVFRISHDIKNRRPPLFVHLKLIISINTSLSSFFSEAVHKRTNVSGWMHSASSLYSII